MKAIFPNAKLLQPIPTPNNEHANISGNVNSTTNVLPNNSVPNTTNTQNVLPVTQSVGAKNENNFSFFTLFYIIILVIAFVIIFYIRKFKKK
jgi:hypothetical protein